ncbi:hypothetical protein MMC07_004749 [Pseudocyphellaria aurata]|nr:hypothetical protein [Pseudocyphellaria aurata]
MQSSKILEHCPQSARMANSPSPSPCTSPKCPLNFPHASGLFLQNGTPVWAKDVTAFEFGSPSKIGGIKSLLDILTQAEDPKSKTRKVTATNEADSVVVLQIQDPKFKTRKVTATNDADSVAVLQIQDPKSKTRKVTATNDADFVTGLQIKEFVPEKVATWSARKTQIDIFLFLIHLAGEKKGCYFCRGGNHRQINRSEH